MRPFIQFSSRNIQKSADYYLSFHIKKSIFAVNFPEIVGFAREYTFINLNRFSNIIPGIAVIHSEYIPVVDLQKKLGYKESAYTGSEKLMLLETNIFDTHVKFAIPYEQLGDAFEITEQKMTPAPTIGLIFESGYIKGMHIHGKECIFVLDLKKIISIDDLIDLKIAPKRILQQ